MGDMLTGKTTQTQEIDPTLRAESRSLMALFHMLAGMDPQVNRGPTIAAFTPKQEQAFGMGDNAAAAFGFGAPTAMSMPEAIVSASGVRGHSTAGETDASISMLPEEFRNAMDAWRAKAGKETKNRKFESGGKK